MTDFKDVPAVNESPRREAEKIAMARYMEFLPNANPWLNDVPMRFQKLLAAELFREYQQKGLASSCPTDPRPWARMLIHSGRFDELLAEYEFPKAADPVGDDLTFCLEHLR